jgi:outer membrane protein OmpA-like peptidoglycan-associated protein
MNVDASYGWEDSSGKSYTLSRGGRRLRFWIGFALIASAAIHVGIYNLLGKIEVPIDSAPIQDLLSKKKNFKLERVTIAEEAPKPEPISPDAEDLRKITEADVVPFTKELDPFDTQKNLPDEEIRLTPEVDEMSNFLASERPSTKGDGSIDLTSALTVENTINMEEIQLELSAIKSRILEKAPASENQLLLQHSVDDAAKIDDEKLLERFNNTLAKTMGDADLTKGFSNLDDLLSQTGPLRDNTKPILMPTDLLFQYDQTELQETARFSMMKLGLIIQRNPNSQFIVEGHTDTIGAAAYNLELSRKRAQSVRDWLVSSLRLDPDQVGVRAMGETKPLANPDGDIGQQSLNRRVEIVIRKK